MDAHLYLWHTYEYTVINISGTGAGIIHYCANMVIVRQFVAKWRPLAIVLGNSGSSVSSLIWPPIMTLCNERYGWRTTFTVLGACSAIGFVSAATFVAPVSNPSSDKTDDERPPKGWFPFYLLFLV